MCLRHATQNHGPQSGSSMIDAQRIINCAMCSKVLFMEERALWDGRARARAPHDDGLRGHKDVSPCRVGWVALTVLCAAKF